MPNTLPYKIKQMTKEEFTNLAIPWAASEGWNPGIYDGDCFYETDPNGYFVGYLRDEPISCISIVSYGGKFAFLGFYIVKPAHRGKGYGWQIWQKALANFNNEPIGLDGVLAQQENYKKSGFQFAYSNIRYQGIAQVANEDLSGIVPVSEIAFEDIVSFDAQHFSVERPQFLKNWIQLPESLAVGLLNAKGKVSGFGVIRKCQVGFKIGPLFAQDLNDATKLFLSLRNFPPIGSPIFLDTPDCNQEALQLAKNFDMKPVFGTARMYKNQTPQLPVYQIFGVTSFELG